MKHLKLPLILTYWLLLLLPLFSIFIYSDNLVNGRYTMKYFFFIFSSSVAIISTLMYSFRREIKLSLSTIDLLLISLYLYLFIRMLLTPDIHIYNTRFITHTVLLFLFFAWKINFGNEQFKNLFFFSLLVIASGQALYGLLQLYHIIPLPSTIGQFQVTGNFGNPSPYASFLGPLVPFALGIYLYSSEIGPVQTFLKHGALITVLLLLLILPATHSRSSWIAALLPSLILLNAKYSFGDKLKGTFHKSWQKVVMIIFLIVILTIGSVTLYQFKKDSAYGRLIQWKLSYQLLTEKPLFGHGYDMFDKVYNDIQANYFRKGLGSTEEEKIASYTVNAHNDYIELGVEVGGIALFILVFLLMSIWRRKNIGYHDFVIKTAIIAFLIEGLFTFPFKILTHLILFTSLLSFFSEHTDRKYKIVLSKLIKIPILILFLFLMVKEKGSYAAHKTWYQANIYSYNQMYASAIPIYEKSFPVLKRNSAFLLNYGGSLALDKKYIEAIPILNEALKTSNDPNIHLSLGNCYLALEDFQKAEYHYQQAEFIEPHKYYPKYLLVKLYNECNSFEKLYKKSDEILNMKIKVNSVAVDQIKQEVMTLKNGFREPKETTNEN